MDNQHPIVRRASYLSVCRWGTYMGWNT